MLFVKLVKGKFCLLEYGFFHFLQLDVVDYQHALYLSSSPSPPRPNSHLMFFEVSSLL